MAIETHLRIRGKLRPGTWEIPEGLRETFENLEWASPFQGEMFDFDECFKDRGGILEPMEELAGKALQKLDVGWMHSDASEIGHRKYRLDKKKKILVEEAGLPVRRCSFCQLYEDEEGFAWDPNDHDPLPVVPPPVIAVEKWRSKFEVLLDFLADRPKQQWAFETKADPFIRKWWDLADLYFKVFELEKGLAFAKAAGRLTAGEVQILTPYHDAFAAYREARREAQTSVLEDPRWTELCALAKATRAKLSFSS